MKKFFLIITLLIAALFLATCFTEQPVSDIEPDDEMMTFQFNNLHQFVDIDVQNGRVAAGVPADQDTLYFEFRTSESNIEPSFTYALSPIPETAEFQVPLYDRGYDVLISTYKNKYIRFKEDFDMKKHLWTWIGWDLGGGYTHTEGDLIPTVVIDINLERHSANFIIRGKEGTKVPDHILSINLTLYAVFDNYAIKDRAHYGWYKQKDLDIPINGDRTIDEMRMVVMGMKDPYDSLGTFKFTSRNSPGGSHWARYWQTYKHKLTYVGGKTTIMEVNLEHLGNRDWETPITWTNEEEDIIIPAGG